MAAESRDQWCHKKISVDHFIPRWPSKIFILIRRSVLHVQLWHYNEGTYDVIKNKITLILHEEYLPCAKFQFISLVRFQRHRGPNFFRFSNMAATTRDLWRHNFEWNILHASSPLWWKFCVNPTCGCGEKHSSSVSTNKQTQTNEKPLIDVTLGETERHSEEHIPPPGWTV